MWYFVSEHIGLDQKKSPIFFCRGNDNHTCRVCVAEHSAFYFCSQNNYFCNITFYEKIFKIFAISKSVHKYERNWNVCEIYYSMKYVCGLGTPM